MTLSIRGRLAAWYACVLLASLVMTGVAVLVVHDRLGLSNIDRDLGGRAATVAAEVSEELDDGEPLAEIVEEVQELVLPGTGVALVTAAGEVLVRRDLGVDPSTSDLAGVEGPVTLPVSTGTLRMLSVPVDDEPAPLQLLVWTPLSGLERERATLVRSLLLGVPLVVLLAAAGGWVIGGQALHPVRDMARQAATISDRHLDRRLRTLHAGDELGALADAFNGLLDRLAAALQLQRRFMADASHELRTPVSVARTTAQVTLGRDSRPEPEYREALETIAAHTERLTRMVDDMFLLALADADGRPLQTGWLYLDELVRDSAAAAGVLGETREVRVVASGPDDVAFEGDEELLRQMVLNLLGNAVRHASSPGRVLVELAVGDADISITVDDTGPGIPEADRDRVFERFVRQSGGSAGPAGGLGLPIARWVAEAHGGSVVAGASPSGGGRFVITLPFEPIHRARGRDHRQGSRRPPRNDP